MNSVGGEINFPKESIFLSDKSGEYFALGDSYTTQYHGLFHFLPEEWEIYKTIEDIRPVGLNESPVIVMQDGFFERNTEHVTERFWFSEKNLVYEIHGEREVSLTLDFRRINDFDDRGRIYSITKEKDILIIEYKKYSDNSLDVLSETKYLAIKGVANYSIVNSWKKKSYEYDRYRGIKSEFYVYDALTFIPDEMRVVFGFGSTKKEAVKNAEKRVKINISSLILDKELAGSALNNLIVNLKLKKEDVKGIFAGYPWFYQFWGRDEAIAVIGLISEQKYDDAKEILMRLLRNTDSNGVLYNRWPHSELQSADATGWMFKRIHQLLIESHKNGGIRKVFSKKELAFIYSKLCSYASYSKSLIKDDLIINKPLETWMDTSDRERRDVRAGARIEIQALHLAIYSLGEDMTSLLEEENADFTLLKERIKEKTKEIFFEDEKLCDGYENGSKDFTARPNVFLAYYAYPNLFSKEEWKSAFKKIIDSCWLEWGGFSTIDKSSYLFREEHTGFNNESYHRGDSWFFVNNIAATCMIHLDRHYFSEYIKKIRKASNTEMTHMGFLGQCAEVSSAKTLCSRGCLAQAWSAGTLIELLHEYHKEGH